MTADKAAMIHESKTSLERWVAALIADPDSALVEVARAAPGKDVYTVEELMHVIPGELEKQNPDAGRGEQGAHNRGRGQVRARRAEGRWTQLPISRRAQSGVVA